MTDDLFHGELIDNPPGYDIAKAKLLLSVTIKDNKGRAWRRRPYHIDLGLGPDGKQCKDCEFLTYTEYAKKYYKCGKHPITGGPVTQISRLDLACAWFAPEETP